MSINVPCRRQDPVPYNRLCFATIDQHSFFSLLTTQLITLTQLSRTSPASLDKRAEELTQILHGAYSGSAKRTLPHNRGQPWWNNSCKEARKAYREKIRSGHLCLEDKKAFRKIIKQAKSSFFQKLVENASNLKEVSDIAKWHKTQGSFRSPPLRDPLSPDSPPAQSTAEKIEVIVRNLLTKQTEVEDIPLSSPSVARNSLPFPNLTPEEVSSSILDAGNTTPGKDEIPTAALLLAWPHISNLVLELFQACIDSGHHPKYFHIAILAIIGKPNKVDMSSPRSYRPIALLSVLGKGLERLITRRMSWQAIQHGILAQQ